MMKQLLMALAILMGSSAASASCPNFVGKYTCWYGIFSIPIQVNQRIRGDSTRLDVFYDGDRYRFFIDRKRHWITPEQMPQIKDEIKDLSYVGKCQKTQISANARGKTLDSNKKVDGTMTAKILLSKTSSGLAARIDIRTIEKGTNRVEEDSYSLSCNKNSGSFDRTWDWDYLFEPDWGYDQY